MLRAGDLVIGDRGYYSIDVCRSLHDSNVDVLLRVKEKASRNILKFVASQHTDSVVTHDGVELRLFKYTWKGERYVLATTRLHLSLERARALYKSRWRIEEGFRRWKSDFNHNSEFHQVRV